MYFIVQFVYSFNEISSNSIANFYIAYNYGHKIISSYNYIYRFFELLSSISLHACNKCIIAGTIVLTWSLPPIVSLKLHHSLQHGWTSFVVEELRADSVIALLTLSELKIASIQKMWP